MAEFWGPMREALRSVNPSAGFEEGVGILKRGITESSALEAGESEIPTSRRRMGF